MSVLQMTHCMACGTELMHRYLKGEGIVPYCPQCHDFRFPVFNTAVSMIVLNEHKDQVLLIKQYGRDAYILVAGYVSRGEDVEVTVRREVMEEMGLEVKALRFNHSHFFEPTNTLMLNFTVVVGGEKPRPNWEIDDYDWFSIAEARKNILSPSLAKDFLVGYLDGVYAFASTKNMLKIL